MSPVKKTAIKPRMSSASRDQIAELLGRSVRKNREGIGLRCAGR